jgi:hypothetical protein
MNIDFFKKDRLIPAIIQRSETSSFNKWLHECNTKNNRYSKVTFYSRSKQRLWTKGEMVTLNLVDIKMIVMEILIDPSKTSGSDLSYRRYLLANRKQSGVWFHNLRANYQN